uniref:Septin-12 isoform X1 n=2 Tax=Pogona vitticeps TaxID=103695 RepID=A0A6J0V134_9SAUR
MSQLSVKEHLDGILSDFEALKRSFDVDDPEEELAFSPAGLPLKSSTPGIIQAPASAEGRRGGGPILPSFQSRISLSSSTSPSHSPVLKTRVGSSLSFNRGTALSPRANGNHLARVSSFQTRLNPNGYSSSLGPGSDNESLHSSSSSLECATSAKGPSTPARPSQIPGMATPELPSSVLKKFSSHSDVFYTEGDQPIRQVSKAAVNHSSLPSLDLHIAEDHGLGLPLCSALGADPAITWRSRDLNSLSPLPKTAMFLKKEALVPPLEVGELESMTFPALASRQAAKLQKFPVSLDRWIRKPPESVPPSEMPSSASTSLSEVQLQVNPGANLSLSQQCPEIWREDKTVAEEGAPPLPSSRSYSGEAGEKNPASPAQGVTLGLVPSPLGQPAAATPLASPASSVRKESSRVLSERTHSVSHPEVPKVQTLVPPSRPREDPPGRAARSLQVSWEKDDSQSRGSSTEEHQPELQPLSMEEQPAREPLSREAPALSTGDRELFGYVGIEAVLDQMRLKTMKNGFEFNIMVVGQSGLGKSTMVNTLFKSKISRKSYPGYEERIPKTVQLLSVTHVVEEKGIKMKLTVTDTPGFGDQINNQNCWDPIVEYINEQYERYLREEILINRKRRIPDTRVHACVYFVPPTGHWLRPLDLECMRRISKITNVVPVIAKADTLTLEERAEFRQRIQKDLKAQGIQVYPQVDFDEDPDEALLNDKIREKIPFAVVGADKEHQVNGKKVLGRKTKWGIIEVENPAHSEFPLLQDLLIRSHLQDLKDITHNVHYEQYRVRRLNESNLPANDTECLVLNSVNREPESHL